MQVVAEVVGARTREVGGQRRLLLGRESVISTVMDASFSRVGALTMTGRHKVSGEIDLVPPEQSNDL